MESGWFIPPQPSERAGALPRDLVTQTEDVLVDTRGYIYVTDKQWGLWILRYTGPDQPARRINDYAIANEAPHHSRRHIRRRT
jgi:hypothetical protein